MKKILASSVAILALAIPALALTIDPATAEAHFVGKKLAAGTKVPGVIQEAKFTFPKSSGSVADILNGAKVEADFAKSFTKDKIREKNIARTFTATLKDSKATVAFEGANGDDAKGTVSAKMTFNGVSQSLSCNYEVVGGKLKVSSVVDMTKDFALNDAYTVMSTDKTVAGLHGKKTWTEVEVFLDVNAK